MRGEFFPFPSSSPDETFVIHRPVRNIQCGHMQNLKHLIKSARSSALFRLLLKQWLTVRIGLVWRDPTPFFDADMVSQTTHLLCPPTPTVMMIHPAGTSPRKTCTLFAAD